MSKELTERQSDILQFIREFIDFNGYPPTYREIGKKFGIASTFGVKRHLDALIKKGHLSMEENSSRTISLTQQSLQQVRKDADSVIDLPIVGRVAAGYPILAEQNIEGSITIQSSLIGNSENCFGLKVRGDSMIEAGIFEGDIVIVNSQKNAANGDIIVAMLSDEATLKRYERKSQTVYLIPENSSYSPIEVNNREDFSIIGKVLGVFRWYN